jgi:hypothetical protein
VTEQQRFQDKQWSQIIARAWADEAFKNRLMSEPQAVLRDHGIEVDDGVQVNVHEETDKVRHLILPPNPAGELSEEELSPTAGADSACGWCHRCRWCGRCGRCGCGCDAF